MYDMFAHRLNLRHRVLGSWFSLVLLVLAVTSNGKTLGRKLHQDDGTDEADPSVAKVIDRSARKPFLALKDPIRAAIEDVQRLYEQGGSVSTTAYLLFAASEQLAAAGGSSNALLPYLTPTILRLYVSKPERCGSDLAKELYELSLSLYGTDALQACHYDLYKALQATFAWVRDNIALRLQQIKGQPLATAAWPDQDLYPRLDFIAVLYGALTDADKLGAIAELVEDSCGLDRADFTALIPRISAVLKDLHADLPLLQRLAEDLHEQHYGPTKGPRGGGRRRSLEHGATGRLAREGAAGAAEWLSGGGNTAEPEAAAAVEDTAALLDLDLDLDLDRDEEVEELADVHRRRRGLLADLPSNFVYSMPASGFVKIAPAAMPRVLVPLIFHIMLYRDGSSIGPAKYDQAVSYVTRLVRVGNIMAKPTNFQFFVKEVRNNATAYPYLLLSDRTAWLRAPANNCTGATCFYRNDFMSRIVDDWPRSVNIFIASDSTSGVPLGYSYVPGSDLDPESGHIFISWDSIIFEGSNSLRMYDDGPNTLVHELFHHFGVLHPFTSYSALVRTCSDEDYVIDTPATLGSIGSSSFYATASAYCMELFWGQYGGNWQATYDRWSTTLGIPDTDRNAWADSCPSLPGNDELGNYMTYNTPVCFAAVGHFTPGQAQRAHLMTAELNPVLYAWAQYYAQTAPPPPPMASPPPEFLNNTCRMTAKSLCPCKASWTLNGTSYSFCDRITATSNSLSCEVQDPNTCADCSTPSGPACILPCGGSARMCKRPVVPGTNMPPPPPPSSPSRPPYPPPPPPRAVPSACKKSSSGCDCRSTWSFGSEFYSYCASPNGEARLWCQVTSSCAGFNNSDPYEYCSRLLNASFCGGPVFFSTTRTPPTPPAPPPNFSPRPPPLPTPAPIAEVRGRFTIIANCSLLASNASALRSDILQSLSQALGVGIGNIAITNMVCGSIIVDYTVFFTAGATSSEVSDVYAAAASLQMPYTFISKWGDVTTATSNVVVLNPRQLCPAGSPATDLCPSAPAPPPIVANPSASESKESKDGGLPLIVIICIAVGGGVSLILLVLLVIILATRKRRVVPSPQAQQHPQQRPQQQLPYPMALPGGGAYPGPYGGRAVPPAGHPVPYHQQQPPTYPPTFQQPQYPQQQQQPPSYPQQ